MRTIQVRDAAPARRVRGSSSTGKQSQTFAARLRRAAVLAAAAAGGLSVDRASAQTRTWINSAGGNFNVAGNWSGGVPIAGQTANFNIASPPYTVTFDISPTNLNLGLSAGTVTFRPDTVSSRTYTLTGTAGNAILLTGGSLTLGAPASGSNTLALALSSTSCEIKGGALTVGSGNDMTSVGNVLLQSPTLSSNMTVTGTGSSVTQNGAATTVIGGAAGTGTSTMAINTNGIYTSGIGTASINPTGAIAIGGGTFNANGDVIVDGGVLSRTSGTFTLGVGRALTAQSNGNISFTGAYLLSNGSALTVQTGGDFSSGAFELGSAGGNATVLVDGSGSTFTTSGLTVGNNASGSVTVRNNATAAVGVLSVTPGNAGTPIGIFNVQSGAVVSTSDIQIAVNGSNTNTGTVTLTGAGTTLNQSTFAPITIGHTATGSATMNVDSSATLNSTGTLTVHSTGNLNLNGGTYNTSSVVNVGTTAGATGAAGRITVNSGLFSHTGVFSGITVGAASGTTATIQVNGGTFTTGTATPTINPTGLIDLTDGIFNANGNITITGGTLQRGVFADFNWAAGKTMTISGGGDLLVTGNFDLDNANIVNASNSGSNVNVNGSYLSIDGSAQLNLSSSADASATGLRVRAGTLTADGSGTTITSGPAEMGTASGTSVMTLTNGATADTQNFVVGHTTAPSATINVNSSSTLDINGTSFTLGNSSSGSATLNLNSSGSLTTAATTTTTIAATGNVVINGGNFTPSGDVSIAGTVQRTSGQFDIASGKTLDVTGDVTLGAMTFSLFNGNVMTVSGSGATFSGISGATNVDLNSQLSVTSGATFTTGSMDVRSGSSLLVDNAALTISDVGVGHSQWGSPGDTPTVTFQNGAVVSVDDVSLADTNANSSVVVTVQSGADVTFSEGIKFCDDAVADSTATLTITGSGSTLLSTFTGTAIILGATSGTAATLNVENGGSLTLANSSTTVFNPTGTLNINGGTVALGGVTYNGGPGINFTTGSLSMQSNLPIGTTGILGGAITLGAGKTLSVSGTTTIDPFQSLSLSGGTLNTGFLVNNNGTFSFTSGTLNFTSGGLNIGSGGALGSTVSLGAGQNVVVSGGVASVLSNGLLVIQSGGTLTGASNVSNAGEIQLTGATAQITAPSLVNSKLVLGDGRINANLNNQAAGEVRASGTQRLVFNGSSHSNSGKINLLNGGTVEFTAGQLFNNAGSTISGRGTLIAAAGISNTGTIQLSGGFSDVFGTLTNNSGGKVIVTGGGTSTFYNTVTASNGSEFRVSTGSTAVFFGDVFGTNNFTGSGTKIFEAGTATLDSLASVVGDTVVESSAVVTAGRIHEDSLTINGRVVIPEQSQNVYDPGNNLYPTGSNASTSKVRSLVVEGAGQLDLGNSDLAIDHDGASPLDAVRNLLSSGFNGGGWDGPGIISSGALNTDPTVFALGYAENADLPNPYGTELGGLDFFGVDVDATALLVKFTWVGDLNLDGFVDFQDLSVFNTNYDNGLSSGRYWFEGDFNYDGFIDFQDLSLFNTNYDPNKPSLPEPGGLGVLALGAMTLAGRRVRRGGIC